MKNLKKTLKYVFIVEQNQESNSNFNKLKC